MAGNLNNLIVQAANLCESVPFVSSVQAAVELTSRDGIPYEFNGIVSSSSSQGRFSSPISRVGSNWHSNNSSLINAGLDCDDLLNSQSNSNCPFNLKCIVFPYAELENVIAQLEPTNYVPSSNIVSEKQTILGLATTPSPKGCGCISLFQSNTNYDKNDVDALRDQVLLRSIMVRGPPNQCIKQMSIEGFFQAALINYSLGKNRELVFSVAD